MKKWWWLLLLALPVGFAIGWAIPPPPLPKLKAEAETWSLPVTAEAVADSKEVIRNSGWEGSGGGDSVSEWKLVGTILPNYALVRTDGSHIVRVRAGSLLPDQAMLLAVSRSRITIERSGCRQVYSVYNQSPIESSGQGCPKASGETTGDKPVATAPLTQGLSK